VEKVVRKFESHEEADQADLEFERSLTPNERMKLYMELLRKFNGSYKGLERVYRSVELKRS